MDVTRLAGADPAVPLPAYQTKGAAGADICANLLAPDRAHGITIAAGARTLIPTGLALAIPVGFEGQVRPRSGLALRHGITVANAPGTIDSDYRGPLGVILINLGPATYVVRHGDRIAQLVIAPVVQVAFSEVPALDATLRGAAGFGSTGTAG